jgi:hypothetical protein
MIRNSRVRIGVKRKRNFGKRSLNNALVNTLIDPNIRGSTKNFNSSSLAIEHIMTETISEIAIGQTVGQRR